MANINVSAEIMQQITSDITGVTKWVWARKTGPFYLKKSGILEDQDPEKTVDQYS